MATPFGTFYSPNITPDKETGIGNWTEKDFIRALKKDVILKVEIISLYFLISISLK